MFATPASLPISNTTFETAAGFWFEILARATVQSLVVLAVIGLFWILLRRHVSHAFAHGLFLLVPARFAAAFVCGLLALEMPMEIPLPFISPTETEITGSDAIPDLVKNSEPLSLPESSFPPIDSKPVAVFATLPGESEHFETAGSQPAGKSEALQVESIARPGFEWPGASAILFGAWFGICSILAIRFLIASLAMHFRLKRSGLRTSTELLTIVADVASELGLHLCPHVVTTPAVHSPAVFGLIRPKLLIPAGFETAFDEAEMRWAIAHELAHLKRRDLWAVAFERVVGLAGFFHPALWLARRATATFRELACDDLAGNVTGLPPRRCAETFLKILVWADRQPAHTPDSPLVLGMNPRFPAIRRRIENMTDQANSKRPARLGLMNIAILALLTMTLSLPVVPKLVAMGPATAEPSAENSDDAQKPEQVRNEGVRVTLKDAETGQPIAGAEVLSFANFTRTIQNTEANGQVSVDFDPQRHDSFSLLIRHSGYIPLQKYWYRNMPQDFPPPDDLQLTLLRGKTIGGRVTDSEGKPIADAEVRVEYEMELDGVRMPSPYVKIQTDADGRWTASCVDPKTEKVVIQVRHPKFVLGPRPYATGNRLVLRKPFQELVDRRHVTRMTPGHKFIATVLGPDGKPVEGARAYLNHLTGLLEDASVASSTEGLLVVGNIGSLEGTPFQTIRVIVHKPGVGWHSVDLAESEFDKPRTIRLEPARKFTLRVVDPEGKPIAGARIMSEFMPGDQSLRINEIKDANGIFENAEFPPGNWRMTAGKGGFHGKSIVVDAARKNDETLVLNREIVAEATVKDAVTGKPVESLRIFQLTGEANGRSRLWFDKNQGEGRFRLTLDQPRKDVNDSDQKSRLRFEADGFEPFETEPFPVTKPPAKFEIALKPGTQGRFVTGKVLKPDGTAAAGAEVGFFTPAVEGVRESVPRIENGRIESFFNRSSSFRRELTRTGADGSFRLPVESDRIGLVVTHESGGFRAAETGPVPQGPVELKLQPFGRVEGQLFVDGKPVASKPLTYEYKFDDGPKESYVVIPFTVVTDEQGRFAVETLVPGNVRFRYAVPSDNGQGGMGQFLGGAVPVAAGATTIIQAEVDAFGLEEVVLDAAGNASSKHTVGSREPVFRVVGIATDADTGQPVAPVLARLATGLKGDDVSVHASSGTIRKGAFETGPFWSRKVDVSKEPVDAWLVVVANGYEPYVSPNRIPQQKGSVRIDVRLKKVDAAKTKTYTGTITLADGSPAFDAKVSATVVDPGIDVGDSKFRWVLNENDTYETDETGRFRIVAPREFETLFVSAATGYAILKAADFLEEPGKNPEVKLTPWSRIEGRVKKGGKTSDRLEMTLSYDGIRLPSHQARANVQIASDGTFAVSRAIAIPATLSLYSKSDWGRFVLEKKVTVESKPGETARVDIDVDSPDPAASPNENARK